MQVDGEDATVPNSCLRTFCHQQSSVWKQKAFLLTSAPDLPFCSNKDLGKNHCADHSVFELPDLWDYFLSYAMLFSEIIVVLVSENT